MGKLGHKVTNYAKQPTVVAASVRTKLDDISTDGDFSGWRSADEDRIAELKAEFSAGRYGLNIFRNPRLLKDCTKSQNTLDPSGRILIDDGLSTALALSSLSVEWEAAGRPEECTSAVAPAASSSANPTGSHAAGQVWQSPAAPDDVIMWDAQIIDIFLNGLLVDFVAYPEDDRDLRTQYNSGIHDEESNKYSETSLVRILVASFIHSHRCFYHARCIKINILFVFPPTSSHSPVHISYYNIITVS